ncbi:alkaline shock response membrane anchor protein AmaP [Streptomyces sp. NPDC048718]|uniref:alkaline shock response membrane anchor protein AmaP n=1 Tax=Streptomyces sp. NPDC048718 TaxID=3365587 RepID=UPI0037116486
MTAVLRRVDRTVLALAGLVLVVGGGAVFAAGLGLAVPSWWPWSGPHDVLLSRSERQHFRSDGWWWPAVIAVLGLVVLLALWWLIAQFRRARLAEVVVDSGDGEEAVVRGRALEAVLAADAEAQEGVARARIALTGRRSAPRARVALLLEPHASPAGALATLAAEALGNARAGTGLAALPAEARLRAVRHQASRVT